MIETGTRHINANLNDGSRDEQRKRPPEQSQP